MTPKTKTQLSTILLALSSLATTWEGLSATIQAAAYDVVGAKYHARVALGFALLSFVLRYVKGLQDAVGNQRAKEAAEESIRFPTIPPPVALLLALCLPLPALPGCAVAPAPPAVVVAPLVPAPVRARLVALIARHPEARPYLVSVANALTSVAGVDARLPDPDGTLATVIQWTAVVPELSGYVRDFMATYREIYPTLRNTGGALLEIAEIIRIGTV